MTEQQKNTNYDIAHSFFIAGVQHHQLRTVINEIKEGDHLILITEPTNKFDPNAVRIEFSSQNGQVMIGYVPKKFSAEVTAMIEIGKRLDCVLVKLNKAAKPWEMAKVEIREVKYL